MSGDQTERPLLPIVLLVIVLSIVAVGFDQYKTLAFPPEPAAAAEAEQFCSGNSPDQKDAYGNPKKVGEFCKPNVQNGNAETDCKPDDALPSGTCEAQYVDPATGKTVDTTGQTPPNISGAGMQATPIQTTAITPDASSPPVYSGSSGPLQSGTPIPASLPAENNTTETGTYSAPAPGVVGAVPSTFSPTIDSPQISGTNSGSEEENALLKTEVSQNGQTINAFGDTQSVTAYSQPTSFDSPSTFQQPNTPYNSSAPDWYQNQWIVNNNITAGDRVTNPITDTSLTGRYDLQPFGSGNLPGWVYGSQYDGTSLASGASFITGGEPSQENLNLQDAFNQTNPFLKTFDQNAQLLQAGLNEVANGINMNAYYSSDGLSPEMRTSPGYQELIAISNDNPVPALGVTGESSLAQSFFNSQEIPNSPSGGGWADFRQSDNVLDLRNQSNFETMAYIQAIQQNGELKNNQYTNPTQYWNSFYNSVGIPAESLFSQSLSSVSSWTNNTWSQLTNLFRG